MIYDDGIIFAIFLFKNVKMKSIGWRIIFLVIVVFLQSCDKDDVSSEENMISRDDVLFIVETEKISDDFFEFIDTNIFDDTQNISNRNFNNLPSCVSLTTIIHSPTEYTFTLKFETNGCEFQDGNLYSGTVIIDRNYKMDDKKFVGLISFDNFYINGIKIEGEAAYERMLINTSGLPQSDYEYEFTFLFENGDMATEKGRKEREWQLGFTTPDLIDNIFSIKEEASILKRNGNEIKIKTIESLVKKEECLFYVSGLIEIEKEDEKVVLDYGDGDCDNKVEIHFSDGTSETLFLNP